MINYYELAINDVVERHVNEELAGHLGFINIYSNQKQALSIKLEKLRGVKFP